MIAKTFHSLCVDLIENHADRCKVHDDLKIFEEMDSAIFIFRELSIDAMTGFSVKKDFISKTQALSSNQQ